ncbi:MAG: ATPase [Candidatus Taylorbacteria bacterium CG11_big_fil_rev_8_21_14_0_20_46_11]|uniref:ATPase n=1 Tax=Candidatus Taylorbacteria bacterium CG11_big_fil_rev_8_21_14_0_20_46_11 TaxID=1975025 RepID=A0A2H0KBL9_9BACT|nr:MAG: ATPase [Candidatus Taylorbacteria bacterium CG11_big_fil_rev_8_21_14_0_20_46_11]
MSRVTASSQQSILASKSSATPESFWHSHSLSVVLDRLRVTNAGLTTSEVKSRQERYGGNALPEGRRDSVYSLFFRQFQSPLIYVLLGAAGIMALMGEITDAVIIFAVLVLNSVVGALQEGRAQNTLLALRTFTVTRATVLRNGKEVIIPDKEVVPGDILSLQEGEKVPADARLLSISGLKINEASLTGESESVVKVTDTFSNASLSIPDRRNMVFKGTYVSSGSATAVVVATGVDTVIGHVARDIQESDDEIPLKKDIRALSSFIIALVAGISILILLIGLARGLSIRELFSTIVALAVSVIPEGLPVVLTLVLASGVWRMGKKHALVKRLQAVEALGQTKIIAVDKTGTLTKNEMVIERVFMSNMMYTVKGDGYEPKGSFLYEGDPIEPPMHDDLLLAGKIAGFCANARLSYDEKEKVWHVAGDPTEAAMLVFAEKLGFNQRVLIGESPPVFELSFDSTRKFHLMTHLLQGKRFMTVVGAPEKVIPFCNHIYMKGKAVLLTKDFRNTMEERVVQLAREGFRVLALAIHENAPETVSVESMPPLTLVGLFAMRDPLRAEVPEAMRMVKEAHMRVIMLTGDHTITAEAIAREAGILEHGEHSLSGVDIDGMSDAELAIEVGQISVYARVTPEHKLRIINAFKKRKEIIAMTGDGVNDAPSLVAADLGVAMGKIGTEVAKEAADIILLDDNFASIVSAAEEGRNIYRTVKKVILYLFSTNLAETLVIVGALILALPLPLLPAQIIWLNFVTDGFLTIALAVEPKEENLLRKPFHRPNRFFMTRLTALRMTLMALVMSIGTLILFSRALEYSHAKALTISLTVLAVFQWFNAWNCRHESESAFRKKAGSNHWLVGAFVLVVVLQLFAVYHPLFQKILHTVPLSLRDWGVIVLVSASVVVVEEARKWLVRRTGKKT